MKEKQLLILAVITALLGGIILFFYAEEFSFQSLEDHGSEIVQLEGKIIKLSVSEKVSFLTLEGCKEDKTEIIVFNDENMPLKEGMTINVVGQKEEYKGKAEVIASSLKIIN